MAAVALLVLVAWLVVVAGVRSYLHYRRTGKVPAPMRKQPGTADWWAGLISTLGIVFAFAGPLAELAGLAPFAILDRTPIRSTGLVLALLGIGGTLGAQLAMGDSWRPDVDPNAHEALVTTGPFRIVRNPILTCTLATALGLALMVPNAFALLMLAAFVIALEIQVRLAEEPYLARVHGAAYRRYAARTGRFLPWIGRLPGDRDDAAP